MSRYNTVKCNLISFKDRSNLISLKRYVHFETLGFKKAWFQVVKVGDFGVARVKAQSGVMTAETGTYRWMAPEVYIIIYSRSYSIFPNF